MGGDKGTVADVPSTLSEALVASLDALSSSSCETTEAALAAVDSGRGAQGGGVKRGRAL